MKDVLAAAGVPTAAYHAFGDGEVEAAHAYLETLAAPWVVKTDGLAAGKGVIVTESLAQARDAVRAYLSGEAFGDAGRTCVIEEGLGGPEVSLFVLCDGRNAAPIALAQDHKRAFDGDRGPNTGGMGAYSPAPVMTPQMSQRTMEEIVLPTVRAMKAMGAPYKGVLFAGLMISDAGPKLIEFNARFGDPETQVLMLRLRSDLVPALLASCDGQLKSFDLRWSTDAALTVVMAAKGYPGSYPRGSVIEGLDEAASVTGVEIFHAGTTAEGGRIVANGGRVLNVTALGGTVGEAQARAYAAVDRIRWPDGFCRRDIGFRAVERERDAR
jgi:phosphoribosylamine--glycine ligase